MKFSIRTLLIITTVLAALAGAASYGLRTIDRIVSDAYRVWGTGGTRTDWLKTLPEHRDLGFATTLAQES